MKLDHLILTRFCVRLPGVKHSGGSGPVGAFDGDPLLPSTLDVRARLFQMMARASLQAQSDPDVGWVVIIDPDLPRAYRARMQALLRSMRRAYLHVFDKDGDDLRFTAWLQPYVRPGTTHLVTTNLDDDDLLPVDFARHCRQHIHEHHAQGSLPPVKILASTRVLQWDMCPTARAPLGSLKPWIRGRFPSSAGLTLMTERKRDDCVLGIRHRFAEQIVDQRSAPENEHVERYRKAFGDVLAAWPKAHLFHDFGEQLGPVLMSNHLVNSQIHRGREAKEQRRRVRTPSDIAFPVDWAAYLRHAPRFTPVHPRYWITRALRRIERQRG